MDKVVVLLLSVLAGIIVVLVVALVMLWTIPNLPAGYSGFRDGQRMATQLANIEHDLQTIKTQTAGGR